MKNVEDTLSNTSTLKELKKIEREINKIENNINKLVDLHLEGILEKENFESKYTELLDELEKVKAKEEELQTITSKEDNLKDRIDTFRKLFENNEILKEFDREIFESVIEKIIVGKIDEDGNNNPYSVTFIFKTGLVIEKNDKNSNLYSYPTHDACGVCGRNTKKINSRKCSRNG